ncbi:ABC transporter permease [Thermogemmatispora sp.]|uniref:ABC transporter permease n=1 Tax=Thermogemmatispora sp. TaxID=1968838 RepID=UPI0035E4081E
MALLEQNGKHQRSQRQEQPRFLAPAASEGGPRLSGLLALTFRRLWRHLLLSEYFVLYITLAYFLVLWPIIPDIASLDNLSNILSNTGPLLCIAIGQTFVLLVAGIDLSQGAIVGLASVIGAMLMTTSLDPNLFSKSPFWGSLLGPHGSPLAGSPLSVPLGIAAMLLSGALVGLLNGVAVTRFRMPPFMVTLVTMIFFDALAIWLTKSETIIFLPRSFTVLGDGALGFVPYVVLIALGLALAAHLLLSQTIFGRHLYAIGTNLRTAIVSGVPTRRAVTLAYVISGFCAGLSSVLYTARLQTGNPTLGDNILLDVIGATVIGGTSLFGGKGKIVWTIFGVLFFVLLDNSLNLLSLSFYTVTAVKGAFIVLAALLNVTRVRFLERSTGK